MKGLGRCGMHRVRINEAAKAERLQHYGLRGVGTDEEIRARRDYDGMGALHVPLPSPGVMGLLAVMLSPKVAGGVGSSLEVSTLDATPPLAMASSALIDGDWECDDST